MTFSPDRVRRRKTIDPQNSDLDKVTDLARWRQLIVQINALVHTINNMGTNAINIPVSPVNDE